jgi:demethylmenaquinone methyltransferase/2-methoxy-6-polyprenyl-1,4-benzoquinol methylase
MFGRIAGWYDFLNHALSLGMDLWWRYLLVRCVRRGPTGRVLDLAAGTLDVTCEILRQHPWASVLALDFSRPMLAKGRPKLARRGRAARALPVLADGRRLPLPDSCVDAVTIAFGIRNILPRSEAYAEILRVLAPGGRLCILEFGSGKRKVWKGMYNFYLHRVLPLLGRVFSGDAKAYTYLADTIAAFPEPGELAAELARAGFARVSWRPMLSGIVAIHLAEKAG